MNDWLSTYLGRGALPRDLSGFEIEAFFAYSESERRVIDDERRTPDLKLAVALQIGFLRMTDRPLEALRVVPPALWRHLGAHKVSLKGTTGSIKSASWTRDFSPTPKVALLCSGTEIIEAMGFCACFAISGDSSASADAL
jgi:Domain of unknown function (DUF4158)